MYKFSSHISNTNLVLVRRALGDGSCAALVVMRTPVRTYAKFDPEPCPPPSKVKKSYKLLWGTLGAVVLTGAAVTYAKSSPEARNWLATNAPWADNFVAVVYQENTTYGKFVTGKFNQVTTFLSHFMFGKEGVTPPVITPRSQQDLEKDNREKFGDKTYKLPPPKLEPLYSEEKTIGIPEIETPAILVQTEKCEPPQKGANEIKISKDLVELEHDMHENTKIAVDNYKKATELAAAYNKALYKIVETPVEELDKKYITELQGAKIERDNTIKKAQAASGKARCALETLDRKMKAGEIKAPPENLTATQRYVKQFRSDLDKSESEFKAELEKGVISDKYWNKVEEARNAYRKQLEQLFPGIDLCARQLDVKADTDLLLLYTLKQVQFLQKELAELETLRELQLSRAIECHDEKALIKVKVNDMLKKERIEKELDFQRRAFQIEAEAQHKLKEELKRNFEIQQEMLQDRLKKKEQEIQALYSREVSEQIERERSLFKRELAAICGKLKAIEQCLKERAKAEEEARRSQSLWAAAESLLATTRSACVTAKIDNEVKALEKAGKDDKLVQTVLKGIPCDARDKGIVTERALREKFDQMEKTATQVALVGCDGAALPVYFLSWLQSKLLFTKFSEIPKDELDNLPTDFTSLDTFDIMQRARYHMDQGNLDIALKYVNLLQGAPRAAALPWVEEARRHLEVKQAAECVMAHASVSGLLYL